MTEKNYGGASSIPKGKAILAKASSTPIRFEKEQEEEFESEFSLEDVSSYKKAGKIAKQVVEFSKKLIKPKMKLLVIAEQIESKIIELGGGIAFPVNLSLNDIAAHYTPSFNDETLAEGLLKIDLGVQVNGCIADTAFSLDLENSEENKKLIEAAERALESGLKVVSEGETINKIGKAIHQEITTLKFSPIRNLCGHELSKYQIHGGIVIPNYDNNNTNELFQGAYAIEPFSTTGTGEVYEGKGSGIYMLRERKGIRDLTARKILDFVEQEYKTLPFCSRWIYKKFGSRTQLLLSMMEQQGILYQFPQLVEKAHGKVAQAEHSFILTDKFEVITD